MTYEHLKEYVYIILDMEKNIYVQRKTLDQLCRTRNSLGIRREIDVPRCEKTKPDYGEYMIRVGLVFAVIGFVIGIIAKWGEFWDNSGIFAVILAPLFGIFVALIAGIVSAIIIGPFFALGVSSAEQAENNSAYQRRLKEYDHKKRNDDNRVKKEMVLRSQVQQEIDILEAKYKESSSRLNDFYNYNIINEKYRYNIVAIASFYQYLDEKRTFSLEFDPKTGDRGAYNIYTDELYHKTIIDKLDVVIDKLDTITANQERLASTIREANRKIDQLSSGVRDGYKRIESAINQQTAIQTYNAERTQAELSFMNTMNLIYSWR